MKRRHPVGPLPVERHETGTAVAMALPVIMNQPTARALPAARSRRLAGMTKRVRFRGGIFGLGGKARQEAPGLGVAMCRRDILQKPPRLAHQPMAKRRGRHDPAALIGKLALFRDQPYEPGDIASLACRPGGAEARGDILMRHGAKGCLQRLGKPA